MVTVIDSVENVNITAAAAGTAFWACKFRLKRAAEGLKMVVGTSN